MAICFRYFIYNIFVYKSKPGPDGGITGKVRGSPKL